jgi:voltage-dependent calcium channel L type alpha-1D
VEKGIKKAIANKGTESDTKRDKWNAWIKGSNNIVVLEGNSLYFLAPTHAFRQICANIVTWTHFDNCVLVLIIISSVLLAIDDPLSDPDSEKNKALAIVDMVITILFLLECCLKIFTFGFVSNGKRSYLKNGWNVLDFIIVFISLISLIFGGDLGKLKALRTFRVLRPLRVISRNDNLKLVIDSLIRSIPAIGNVMLICLFFFLIFGIICVNYFKGTYFYCKRTNGMPN